METDSNTLYDLLRGIVQRLRSLGSRGILLHLPISQSNKFKMPQARALVGILGYPSSIIARLFS